MKNFKSLFLLFALPLIISCNQKEQQQNISDNENVVSVSDEKKKIATAVDSLNNAIVNPDKSLLEEITVEGLTYGHSSGLVQNREEFIDDLINGDFDFSSVNSSDQTIHIAGETAVVRQTFSAKATNAGDLVDIRIGNVLVYIKQDGQWKLLARQAFKL